MDSCWFAVDEDGNIAYFDTGESGAMPESGFPSGLEAGGYGLSLEPSEMLAFALGLRALNDPRLAELLVDVSPDQVADASVDFDADSQLLRKLGVYTYDCDEPDAVPYVRNNTVDSPLTIHDLTPELAKLFSHAKLQLRFKESTHIAPGEHTSVTMWGEWWVDTKGQVFDRDGTLLNGQDHAPPLQEDADTDPQLSDAEFYELIQEMVDDIKSRPTPPPKAPTFKTSIGGWIKRLFGG